MIDTLPAGSPAEMINQRSPAQILQAEP